MCTQLVNPYIYLTDLITHFKRNIVTLNALSKGFYENCLMQNIFIIGVNISHETEFPLKKTNQQKLFSFPSSELGCIGSHEILRYWLCLGGILKFILEETEPWMRLSWQSVAKNGCPLPNSHSLVVDVVSRRLPDLRKASANVLAPPV